MAAWIARVVARRGPNAVRSADPFHIVAWGIEALDVERRRAWHQAPGRHNPTTGVRRGKATGTSLRISRARYALWKNPGDLTNNQRTQLEWIAKTDPRLHRAYLLKEGLRFVFAIKGDQGEHALDRWLSWARRSRIQSFVELARKLVKHRTAIDHTTRLGSLQRTHRVDEHQDPVAHPDRLRVQEPPRAHRSRHARPRQPPTRPPRPKLTHRSSRRAQ